MADECGQVPMDEIDIFDIASYYNASTPDGTWFVLFGVVFPCLQPKPESDEAMLTPHSA